MLVLFTWDIQLFFFSFRREGLDLEGLSLIDRKFDLRENFSLGSDSSSLRNDSFSLVGIVLFTLESPFHLGGSPHIMKGLGVYLQRKPPIFTIGSNFELDFLFGRLLAPYLNLA